MESLQAILRHAPRCGLRWVIVADPWYDPLPDFAGWRRVNQLGNGAVIIWSKDGIPLAVPMNPTQIPLLRQGILRGILPFGSSILAALALICPWKRRRALLPKATSSARASGIFPSRKASSSAMARQVTQPAKRPLPCTCAHSARRGPHQAKKRWTRPPFCASNLLKFDERSFAGRNFFSTLRSSQ